MAMQHSHTIQLPVKRKKTAINIIEVEESVRNTKSGVLHEHVRMQVIIKYLGMYCDYLLYEKYMIYGYLIQNKSKKFASHQGLRETEASTSSATSYLSTVFDRKALSRSDISGSDGPSNHSRRAARKHWAEFFGWSLSIAFME